MVQGELSLSDLVLGFINAIRKELRGLQFRRDHQFVFFVPNMFIERLPGFRDISVQDIADHAPRRKIFAVLFGQKSFDALIRILRYICVKFGWVLMNT